MTEFNLTQDQQREADAVLLDIVGEGNVEPYVAELVWLRARVQELLHPKQSGGHQPKLNIPQGSPPNTKSSVRVAGTVAWDDADDDNPPVCKTCGVPMANHAGIYGTCAKLQAARAAFKKLHAAWLTANHRKEMNGGMDGLASALGLDPFTLEANA